MENSSPRAFENRIVFLDYLRIFAFVSVLIGHKFVTHLGVFITDAGNHTTPLLFAKTLLHFVVAGGAGVTIFFLVSGYISLCD